MTFTPIETQEAFEAALKERLERERSTMTKKFEGYHLKHFRRLRMNMTLRSKA